MASRQEIEKILALLSAAYPMFTVPKETAKLYYRELTDIPISDLLIAARAHYKGPEASKYFPTIAELTAEYYRKKKKKEYELELDKDGRAWFRQREQWKLEATGGSLALVPSDEQRKKDETEALSRTMKKCGPKK